MDRISIFTGRAHQALAASIVEHLAEDGVVLGKATVGAFSDGETQVKIHDNVRGSDVYVVQPTCAPANQNLVELLVMVDALKRASAGSITAVMPYYGYARQDRKSAPRTPITAKLVADLLTTAGIDRLITVDLHAGQIQGYFDIPVDHLYARPVFVPYLAEHYAGAVVVSPDAGGAERARSYSKLIPRSTLALIDKRRERANESEVMHILGDVEGRKCLIVDDMIDTAGTLVKGADALLAAGATSVGACATHGVFSGPAAQRVADGPLTEIVVSDSIPACVGDDRLTRDFAAKLRVISIAHLLGEAIRRVHHGDSVSSLFSA